MTRRIQELTSTVVEQSAELDGAIAAERHGRAELLRQTIDIVRPALNALSSKLWAARTYDVLLYETQTSYFTFRGIELYDGTLRRALVHESDGTSSGEYRGTVVLLDAKGQLYLGDVSGEWSEATNQDQRQRTAAEATYLDVVTRVPLHQCVEAIVRALEAYASGNAQKVAARARRMAERLSAISVLLRE